IREAPLRTIKSDMFGTMARFSNCRESSSLRRPGLRNGIDYYGHARSTCNTYQVKEGSPMANVVKKYTISSELAQKMVNEAVAKAREIGVTENVAILDDGGNLKAFDRMNGAPILCIDMAQ